MDLIDLAAITTLQQNAPMVAAAASSAPNPWGQPQTIIAAVASIVALFAYFNAQSARRDVKIATRQRQTDKHLTLFRSPMMRVKRQWVERSLAAFANQHRLGQQCGLSALKTGTMIRLKASNGDTETLTGGEIALHVMEHIDDIARDMRHGRLDNHAALQTMGEGLISAWAALGPYMPGRWSPEYYQYTWGRWSIRSLVRLIQPHSTVDARFIAVRDRWGYVDE